MTYPPNFENQQGQPPQQPPPYYPPQPPPLGPSRQLPVGLSVAGMVTGIVGLVFEWVPILGLTLGVVGVVLSGVGISRVTKGTGSGKGMAIAGLVCAILAVLLGLFWTIGVLVASTNIH